MHGPEDLADRHRCYQRGAVQFLQAGIFFSSLQKCPWGPLLRVRSTMIIDNNIDNSLTGYHTFMRLYEPVCRQRWVREKLIQVILVIFSNSELTWFSFIYG